MVRRTSTRSPRQRRLHGRRALLDERGDHRRRRVGQEIGDPDDLGAAGPVVIDLHRRVVVVEQVADNGVREPPLIVVHGHDDLADAQAVGERDDVVRRRRPPSRSARPARAARARHRSRERHPTRMQGRRSRGCHGEWLPCVQPGASRDGRVNPFCPSHPHHNGRFLRTERLSAPAHAEVGVVTEDLAAGDRHLVDLVGTVGEAQRAHAGVHARRAA